MTYATPSKTQTFFENGFMNENVDGGSFVGFRYSNAIPFSKWKKNQATKITFETSRFGKMFLIHTQIHKRWRKIQCKNALGINS